MSNNFSRVVVIDRVYRGIKEYSIGYNNLVSS